MNRVKALFLIVLGGVLLSAVTLGVQASDPKPFHSQAFAAAVKDGGPVLVEIHADWCPTCKAQAPILNKLSDDPAFSGLVRFRVDFDNQKDVVKSFNARTQSTLIVFKGGREVARSVGDTDAGRIRAMLDKAL